MKFDNQLRYASTIIASYEGEIPLHVWLKNFFREHKQMGSKDRRLFSNMAYGFYRLGHAIKDIPSEERILTGLFLCNESPQEILQYFRPEWNGNITRPLEEKIVLCRQSGIPFVPADIFPWKDELSEGIDHGAFCLSFLRQPDLFLRIRPGQEKEVLRRLEQPREGMGQPIMQKPGQHQDRQTTSPVYEFIPPFTLRLPNGFNVEEWFTPDKEVVIQDYSSQRLASFLQLPPGPSIPAPSETPGLSAPESMKSGGQTPRPYSFWDACAASGGKSILAFDLNPHLDITVSDIRESILHNLHQRFRQAGIKNYHSFVANLATSRTSTVSRSGYDLILADVPCSGSGTWSRTPEELYFFHPKKILQYSEQQKKIVANILPDMKKGARFVYSTCSVFKKENEEIVAFIRNSSDWQPDRMESIKGYDQKADSMFAAGFVV